MENDTATSGQKPEKFLIVGIGASAGGVQALKEFFQHVPADSGLAFVVILHLSPDHDSQLAQVLQNSTPCPVKQVTEKVKVEPDHIYVVPPNQHLIMEDGFIIPTPNLKVEDRRAPVDIFFRTLAETHGPQSVAVVLSGTGANGSMGLKRIKEMGGVAFVQNPREAEFNEMPRNSIATELVDEVLAVAEIPAKIMAYRDSIGTVEIELDPANSPEHEQQALREIFTELRLRTGHDFSNYKRATVLRRIERRINIHNLHNLFEYTKLIQHNPDETHALLKDLLISVTNFFRDHKAFYCLETDVIPALFQGKNSEDQVRIWIAGCATGEEAYSVAMLCAEYATDLNDAPKIQIFATDIDETAINIAREGLYTLNDAADVSPDRLRRFFNKDEDGYRVKREIRELVLFADHNFLKDPPFFRLNLISCRNVLIYLNANAQERVMETFHFALITGGFLFLGNSESVDGANDLFAPFNRENHLFRSKEVQNKTFPVPESIPKFLFSQNPYSRSLEKDVRHSSRISFGELHHKLLEEYAPPSVVINEDYDIMHMSETVGRYFEFTAGEPSQNLLKLVKPEIRLELRTALYQAVQRKSPVDARNIHYHIDSDIHSVDLHIRPVVPESTNNKCYLLVVFSSNEEATDALPVIVSSDEPVSKKLEEELVRLKSQLRNSNEEHEYQSEELKAANEELQAMNEEMRSAAEELETSKEELQSINEELRTVNQELKVKIEEISHTTNNLQNLINSADVGTIFLDRSLRTRLFTPAMGEIFNLIPSDYGRPISDITNKLEYPDLTGDAEQVLDKLTIVERELKTTDNRFFMMRILPYRTAEDKINGVVITFFDITKRRKAEHALQQSEEFLRLLIESAKDYAIFTIDTHRKVSSWSTGAQIATGYAEMDIIGHSADIIFTPEDRDKKAPETETTKALTEGRAQNERWHVRKDGSSFWGSGSVSPLRDEKGELLGFVKIMRDLTERRVAEQHYKELMENQVYERTQALQKSKQQYASLVENTPDVITRWNDDLKLVYANSAFTGKPGAVPEQLYGKTSSEMGQQDEIAVPYMNSLRKVFETGQPVEHFNSFPSPNGELFFYSRMVPEINTAGQVETVLAIARDITDLRHSQDELIKARESLERAKAEKALRTSAERLQLALDAGKLGTYEYDFDTGEYVSTAQHKANFGYGEEDIVSLENLKERIIPEDRKYMETSYTDSLRDNAVYLTEYRIRWPDGKIRWIRSVGRFEYNVKNKPQKMIGISLDITEERMFTEELSKQVKQRTLELLQSNNDLRQFAHVASHDLKEPVRKIQVFYNRIRDEYDNTLVPQVKKYLEKIGSSADRMLSMINGVLLYSKFGNMEAAGEEVNLDALMETISVDLELLMQEKAAVISKKDLPVIRAGRFQMYQLFYNLTLNSLKFSNKNKPVKIKLKGKKIKKGKESFIRITFSDNGIGFEPEYEKEIFQTFTRLHSSGEYEGTGLGLALCKKIVERYGGTISATGKPGKGAEFIIELPA